MVNRQSSTWNLKTSETWNPCSPNSLTFPNIFHNFFCNIFCGSFKLTFCVDADDRFCVRCSHVYPVIVKFYTEAVFHIGGSVFIFFPDLCEYVLNVYSFSKFNFVFGNKIVRILTAQAGKGLLTEGQMG